MQPYEQFHALAQDVYGAVTDARSEITYARARRPAWREMTEEQHKRFRKWEEELYALEQDIENSGYLPD